MKALIIKTDETTELVDLSDKPGDPSIRVLQDAVGGYIELVLNAGDWVLYANEDGLRLNLPVNRKASALIVAMCQSAGRPVPNGADRLVGNAIIVGSDGGEDNQPIPQEWVEEFASLGLWPAEVG